MRHKGISQAMSVAVWKLVFLVTLVTASCGRYQQSEPPKVVSTPTPSVEIHRTAHRIVPSGPDTTTPRAVLVEDSTVYSSSFLQSLRKLNYPDTVRLFGRWLLVGKDSVSFPDSPALGQRQLFIARNGDTTYALNVYRVKFSTIAFDFRCSAGKAIIERAQGEADLHPSFFLGAETDLDENGEGVFADEYLARIGRCSFSIRISEAGARIHCSCRSEKRGIRYDRLPLLSSQDPTDGTTQKFDHGHRTRHCLTAWVRHR